MKRKSIVLSDTEGETTKKAVLTLDEKDGGIAGTLRLYNFPSEPNGILSLGLYSGQKVVKAGLTRKGQMLYDFFVNIKEIPQKFSCAIVNFQNAEPKPVLYGSSEGSDDNVFASIISEVSGKSFEKTKEVLDKYDVDFDENEKKEIEEEIDRNLCQENCANCIYKKYFYENSQVENKNEIEKNGEKDGIFAKFSENLSANSHVAKNFKAQMFGENGAAGKNEEFENSKSQTFANFENGWGNQKASQKEEFFLKEKSEEKQNQEKKDEEKRDEINQKDEQKIVFFDRLKPQIDKLFETNPAENNLQNLFPASKWVKVEYEDEGDFFVFGLLYDEDGNVKYVCYGVPAVFDENPPEELAGYPIWLPLDEEKGFGYWMTYQDAVTGEPLKAILD